MARIFTDGEGRAGARDNRSQPLDETPKIKSCRWGLGDIPDALTATNMLAKEEIPSAPTMAATNVRLKEWAAKHPLVVILPLAKFMRDAKAGVDLTMHHQAVPQPATRSFLQEDYLHPVPQGCAVLSLANLDAFDSTRTNAPDGEIS